MDTVTLSWQYNLFSTTHSTKVGKYMRDSTFLYNIQFSQYTKSNNLKIKQKLIS